MTVPGDTPPHFLDPTKPVTPDPAQGPDTPIEIECAGTDPTVAPDADHSPKHTPDVHHAAPAPYVVDATSDTRALDAGPRKPISHEPWPPSVRAVERVLPEDQPLRMPGITLEPHVSEAEITRLWAWIRGAYAFSAFVVILSIVGGIALYRLAADSVSLAKQNASVTSQLKAQDTQLQTQTAQVLIQLHGQCATSSILIKSYSVKSREVSPLGAVGYDNAYRDLERQAKLLKCGINEVPALGPVS